MPSNEIHAVNELTRKQRAQRLSTRATELKTIRDQLVSDLDAKEREIDTLSARQAILTKVSELYLMLMDRMIMGQVKVIDDIITSGFQTIFFDQNLRWETELSSQRGKINANFFICDENAAARGDPLESFGGGPAVIASLILRILTILRLNRRKVLLLDETLFAVSDDYVEATSQFLKSLSDTMGLEIFFVTHKHSYLDYISTGYQADTKVESGRNQLTIKRVRGSK